MNDNETLTYEKFLRTAYFQQSEETDEGRRVFHVTFNLLV